MKAPARFQSLDALRGIAAMSVVLFHWRMWSVDANWKEAPFNHDVLPLGRFLAFFYDSGYAAVGLFFSLSGFVFYWLYRSAIGRGEEDAWRFTVGRLSRLYPLHFATLLLAALVQWGYAVTTNSGGFEFSGDSPFGFVRHMLVFPLAVGHRHFDFNSPDWTLGVEAWLYLIFFVAARFVPLRFVATATLVAVGAMLQQREPDIGYGVVAFFMGGIAFLIFERVESPKVDATLRVVLAVSWICSFVIGSGLIDLPESSTAWLRGYYALYVMFPCTVLYLAITEARRGALATRFAWLGDMTYSSYLLHFPLMALFALALRSSGHDFSLMLSPIGLALFFGVLVPLSIACHRYFERPAQRWIRERLLHGALRGSRAITVAPAEVT